MGPGVGNMDKAVGRPPLEVFRFFDVAGRHESFAEAARELGVTSGAVAHRVRTLEHYLGEQLFERQPQGLALSTRGQAFLVEVQHTLSALDKATERFRAGANAGALKLVTVEAFAELWLMPRLAAFRRAHRAERGAIRGNARPRCAARPFLHRGGDPCTRPICMDGRCSTIWPGRTTGRTGLPAGRPARRTCPGRRGTVYTR